jgi:hypothetical protein
MRLSIAVALLVPIVASAADRLNVKTGLWEITATTEMSGMPPLPKELLDQMPAEQRAQLESQIKQAAGGEATTETSRECISERDLEKPFESANPEDCKQQIVKSTRTMQEVKLTCTGEYQGSGNLRIHTPTPETMTGDMDVSVGDGSTTMTVKAKIKGRWLGADCGEEADDEDEDNEEADDAEDEDEA